MEEKYDWFYAQRETPLAGLWVALEDVSGMPGPRILDSDESLATLVCRLDRRLHQGVLIGRVPSAPDACSCDARDEALDELTRLTEELGLYPPAGDSVEV